MAMIPTRTPLVSMRCPAHGTFRATAGTRCPQCPPIATEPAVITVPGEFSDFPSEEPEDYAH